MTKKDATPHKETDPTHLPAYAVADAARMVGVPPSTVRNWVIGRPDGLGQGAKGFPPAIRLDNPSGEFLSFRNLVELYVLAAIRKEYGLTLQNVRRAIEFIEVHLGADHPLATKPMLTDGKDLLVREGPVVLNVSQRGQRELGFVTACLERIEFDQEGNLLRLYPFSTTQFARDKQAVVIDPRTQFGRPCLREVGIPTEVIMERFLAGELIEELAADYEIDRGLVEEAIRFEQSGRAA